MRKSKRLSMSNNAHARLMRYHSKRSDGNNVHFVKMNYHSSVLHTQQRARRILTASERKKKYDDVIRTFY